MSKGSPQSQLTRWSAATNTLSIHLLRIGCFLPYSCLRQQGNETHTHTQSQLVLNPYGDPQSSRRCLTALHVRDPSVTAVVTSNKAKLYSTKTNRRSSKCSWNGEASCIPQGVKICLQSEEDHHHNSNKMDSAKESKRLPFSPKRSLANDT